MAELGRLQALQGELEAASETLERALRLAEALALEEPLVQALISKEIVLENEGRRIEARSLLETALAHARAAELHDAWARAGNNLAVLLENLDEYSDVVSLMEELEVQARQRGDREFLALACAGPITAFAELGRWQDARARAAEAAELQASRRARAEVLNAARVLCEQGELAAAEALLAEQEWQRDAEQSEPAAAYAAAEARVLRARAQTAEALAAAERGLGHRSELGIADTRIRRCLVEALECALELDDVDKAGELLATLDQLQPGQLTPILSGERARFHARLATRRGDHAHVNRDYSTAEKTFADSDLVFRHAVTQLEHAEWLTSQRRGDQAQPLLDDARQTFERLQAEPWLRRVETLTSASPAPIPA